MSRDFLTNRNRFKKIYNCERQPSAIVNYVINNITKSFNQNSIVISRDCYILLSVTSSSNAQIYGLFDEDYIWFSNETEKTKTFNLTFSEPPIIVLVPEPTSLNTQNLNPFIVNSTTTNLTVGLSAPFSGAIRYLAVYSTTYPTTVQRNVISSSQYYDVSAGYVDVTGSFFTASYSSLGSVPTNVLFSTFDNTNNNLADISIVDSGSYEISSTSGSFSETTTTRLNFIAIK